MLAPPLDRSATASSRLSIGPKLASWLGGRARIVSALVAVVALATAAFSYVSRQPIAVSVSGAEANVPIRVFGLGTVEARIVSRIGFEVGAAITELNADHGDTVKQGQVLAKLHATQQQAKVARAKAAVLSAEVAIRKAEATVTKTRAILAQRLGGQQAQAAAGDPPGHVDPGGRGGAARRGRRQGRRPGGRERYRGRHRAARRRQGTARLRERDPRAAHAAGPLRRSGRRSAEGARHGRQGRRHDLHAGRRRFRLGAGLHRRVACRSASRRARPRKCACAPASPGVCRSRGAHRHRERPRDRGTARLRQMRAMPGALPSGRAGRGLDHGRHAAAGAARARGGGHRVRRVEGHGVEHRGWAPEAPRRLLRASHGRFTPRDQGRACRPTPRSSPR